MRRNASANRTIADKRSVTHTPAQPAHPAFIPPDLDAGRHEAVEALVRALLDRPIESATHFERWLVDRSELDAACSEAEAVRYIAMTCSTDDAAANTEYERFVRETLPHFRRFGHALDLRQNGLAVRLPLDAARYLVLERDVANEASLFCDENVPIQTELAALGQEYEQILGAMTVQHDGRERTMAQMGVFLEQPDRAVRERAWRAVAGRRLRDKDRLEALFDRMLPLRGTLAHNAGLNSYVDYAFRSKRRFDYSPADCARFHRSIAGVVMPLVRELDESRRLALGLDAVRPWDAAVDPHGAASLRPFTEGADLAAKTLRVFARLDQRLGAMTAELISGDMLDLDSRKGKAPGGYQYMRDRVRKPFIFMNAAGLHRDVRTMVHEVGHAFHSQLTRDEPLVHYRHSVTEFAEVASMSMELLTMPHWDIFYPEPADLRRAKREQLEGVAFLLPWVATIDAFQLWIYTHPGHSAAERRAEWLRLHDQYGRVVDWSGLDEECAYAWHRQPHLFTSPMYYVEYGIAQLGALQLWLRSLDEGPAPAIEDYIRALSLGGSRPLPDLFKAAGLEFDFGEPILERLIGALRRELAALSD